MTSDHRLAELSATHIGRLVERVFQHDAERFRSFASPMKKRLTAIFIYADGCSLRLDHMLGDPPPRRVVLRTESQFKEGIFRFRLRAVYRYSGEARYEEAGPVLSRQRAE